MQSWFFSFITPVFSVTWSWYADFLIIINVEDGCAAENVVINRCFIFQDYWMNVDEVQKNSIYLKY